MNYIRGHTRGITLTIGCTGESGFDPVELWVMGPPCGLKVGGAVTSGTVMIASMLEGNLSVMVAKMLVPRVRDEENHFPTR